MAIVQNPLTGRTRGRFGNAVFYTRNGKNCIRTKAETVNDPNTPAQQEQRARQKAAVLFYQLNRSYFDKFLKIGLAGMTAFNRFLSWNIKNFNTTTGFIDVAAQPNFRFASGALALIRSVECTWVGSDVNVLVDYQENEGFAKNTDQITCILYNSSRGDIQVMTKNISTFDGTFLISRDSQAGDRVAAYVVYHNAEYSLCSNSVCGILTPYII